MILWIQEIRALEYVFWCESANSQTMSYIIYYERGWTSHYLFPYSHIPIFLEGGVEFYQNISRRE